MTNPIFKLMRNISPKFHNKILKSIISDLNDKMLKEGLSSHEHKLLYEMRQELKESHAGNKTDLSYAQLLDKYNIDVDNNEVNESNDKK